MAATAISRARQGRSATTTQTGRPASRMPSRMVPLPDAKTPMRARRGDGSEDGSTAERYQRRLPPIVAASTRGRRACHGRGSGPADGVPSEETVATGPARPASGIGPSSHGLPCPGNAPRALFIGSMAGYPKQKFWNVGGRARPSRPEMSTKGARRARKTDGARKGNSGRARSWCRGLTTDPTSAPGLRRTGSAKPSGRRRIPTGESRAPRARGPRPPACGPPWRRWLR